MRLMLPQRTLSAALQDKHRMSSIVQVSSVDKHKLAVLVASHPSTATAQFARDQDSPATKDLKTTPREHHQFCPPRPDSAAYQTEIPAQCEAAGEHLRPWSES
jgi:hypothetical protein